MIQNIPLEKVLFLDIETVPQLGNWDDLSETDQYLWDKKTKFQRKEEVTAEEFYKDRGGIMAEFGKIICISVGIVEKNGKLMIKSFYGDDEKILLQEFGEIFNRPKLRDVILCAHNGKEFDFPWIARRFLINGMQPPVPFQMFGKKPWEIPHLDTLELWKFGDYKHFTSLKLMCKVLAIPSPKGDIDGSQVGHVFYVDKDIDRIVTYCEKDTIAVAQIFLRLRREDLLIEDEIIHV